MADSSKVKTNVIYNEFAVLSLGDIEGGFVFYGPFEGNRSASDWAKDNVVEGVKASIITVRDIRDLEDQDESID